jgi:hypothetical protein
MDTVYTALVFPLLLLVGQTLVALGQRNISQRMDERHEETERKRRAEAEWRDDVERRLARQDEKISAVLKGQTTQMRSDLIHRAHRYLDDLGKASTDEKDAFNDEYSDYCAICEAYGITNSFIDELARRVMALPEREI